MPAQVTAACSIRASPASTRARSSRTAASTAAAVSRSAVLPVMGQFQHRPPTVRPRKPGSPQGSEKLFRELFRARFDRSPRVPTGPVNAGAGDVRRRLVSTSSTRLIDAQPTPHGLDRLDHRGLRAIGLDRLDHRGAAWSRQARPTRVGLVSTSSTNDWARPPMSDVGSTSSTTEGGVVSTSSTNDGARPPRAAWSRQARPTIGLDHRGGGVVSTSCANEHPRKSMTARLVCVRGLRGTNKQ